MDWIASIEIPPTQEIISVTVRSGLVPAAVTMFVLLAGPRLFRSDKAGAPIALTAAALGFVAGFAASGFAQWSPGESWQWLLYAVPAGALAGMIVAADGCPRWAGLPLMLIVSGAVAYVCVPAWESLRDDRLYWIVGLGIAIVLVWSALTWAARRWQSAGFPLLLGVIAICAAVVCERAAIAKFAQVAGIVAAVLGAVIFLRLIQRKTWAAAGVAPLVAIGLPVLMANARLYSYSDVPFIAYVLVAAALFTAPLGALGPIARLRPLPRGALRTVLSLSPAIAGAIVAIASMASGETGDYGY